MDPGAGADVGWGEETGVDCPIKMFSVAWRWAEWLQLRLIRDPTWLRVLL